MRNLNLAAGIAACVMALSGCAEDTARDDTDTTGGANTTGGVNATNGGTNGGTNSTNGGTNSTNGGTNATNGGTNATEDGGSTGVAGGDAGDSTGDDPSTPGNDSSTAVSCTADVGACDLTTNSCCVADFDAKAVSCESGTTCAEGSRAPCDGKEDCGDQEICCLQVNTIAGQAKQGCVAEDACTFTFEFQIAQQLCHTDDECVGDGACSPGNTFPWWGVCN